MAIDPRLMMIDYSGITQAMGDVGQGQVQGLAGKAMMGDPNAMQALQKRSPMMAAQVQQQQAQSQAAQKQAEFQNNAEMSKEMERFYTIMGGIDDPEQFLMTGNQLLESPMFINMRNHMEQTGDYLDYSDFDNVKLLAKQKGGDTGYGGLSFKEVQDAYVSNPVVQDFLKAKNSVLNIKDSYETLKKNPKDQAAQFAIAKSAIQMIESGVVRPEEFSAAAGIALPQGMSPTEAMDYLYTRISDGLTLEQATNLANMGRRAYNAKVKNVISLQESMQGVGFGKHDPKAVFSTASAEELPDFVGGKKEGNVLTDVIKEITSKAEYDALPSGARYIQNGIEYLKK